jgi:outer membrane PBP1 activator LpoA protein
MLFDTPNFIGRLGVIIFATMIVAIGAKPMLKDHQKIQGKIQNEARGLLRRLDSGTNTSETNFPSKAMNAAERKSVEKKSEASSKQTLRPISELKPEAKKKELSKVVESTSTAEDSLSSDDRSNLQNLLKNIE